MKKLLLSFIMLAFIGLSANAQWQQTSLDSGQISCFTINGNNIFAGSSNNGIYLSSNNGNSWVAVNNGLIGYHPTYVYALAIKGDSVFAGTMGGVYLSSNNGSSWAATSLINMNVNAFAISGNTLFAGTYSSGMYLSTNNGSSWTSINNGLPYNSSSGYPFVAAISINGSNIFAGTDNGVFLSSNNGTSWADVNIGLTNTDVLSLCIKGDTLFAGTSNGVYMSLNNGSNWASASVGLVNNAVNALAINGNTLFAGTSSGVFMSLNNGNNWVSVSLGLASNAVKALAIIGDTLYAGTYQSGAWYYPLSLLNEINEGNANDSKIVVYPNPATSNLIIESLQKSTIEILNIQGQTILQQSLQQGKTDIDISRLAKGVYIIRLCSNDKTEVARIVKE